jgi:membrane fusion protein (multidrug efflux system)
MDARMSMPRPTLALALAATLLLAGCGEQAGGPAGGGAPASTVTTATVARGPWRDAIEAVGTAQARESVVITAKVTETVERVNFEDGAIVQAGDVLVDLSGRAELAGLEEARTALREASQQLERQEQLAAQRLIPASQLDAQRASRDAARARMDAVQARLGDRVITAPFAGVLGFRQVSPGSLVSPGTPIATLDDISIIKLDFSVPEAHLASLAIGQDVQARSIAYGERGFSGTVTSIGSRVDPVSRTVAVRAEIANPEGALRPGMLLTVRLLQPPREVVAIPEIAVVQVGGQAFVYTVDEAGLARRVDVRLGARRPGEVEVREGLAGGERLVVDGTVKLRDGAPVRDVGAEAAAQAPAAAG